MKIIEFLQPGFDQHTTLNPLLWQDEKSLHPEIKNKLLKIAQHFKHYVDIDFPILDIVVTGGQTGKFYTEHSDIDLHIVTDYDRIQCDQEASELFDTKRKLYQKEYDIKIKGIPVELYVEDKNKPAVGGAISLLKNKWIKQSTEPTKQIDSDRIIKISEKFSDIINRSLASNNIDTLKNLKDQIWKFRQTGLAKEGEFGTANLVFKTLRNSGLLKQLLSKIKDLENKDLSIDQ